MPTPFTLTGPLGEQADLLADITTTPEGGAVRLGLSLSLAAIRPPAGSGDDPVGTVYTYDTPGIFAFTPNFTGTVLAECYGGGGMGGAPSLSGGNGGYGGAYANKVIAVTAGVGVAGAVGAGGSSGGGVGGDSSFASGAVLAAGGSPNPPNPSAGDVIHAGGAGGSGGFNFGGGGGASGNVNAAGQAGSSGTAGVGANGGGSGGAGGVSNGSGAAGSVPGGGGGGGAPFGGSTAAGAAGKVVLTRVSWPPTPRSRADAAAIAAAAGDYSTLVWDADLTRRRSPGAEMPHLFADAETEALFRLVTGTAVGGVLGVTFAVLAGVFWVRRQIQTVQSNADRNAAVARVVAATADAAEAEAAATPIAQWQQIVRRQDAKMDRLSAKVDECNERHRECEDRASKQQTEIEALKTQNAGQQKQLDKVATRVAKIKTAVGLAPDEDSGPQPRFPAPLADTDEHTPLTDSPPKG